MAVSLVVFAFGGGGPIGFSSGYGAPASVGTAVFGLVLGALFVVHRLSTRAFPAFGSVNISTGWSVPVLS